MRRADIEDVLGAVEFPEVAGGHYLIDILFRVGPVRSEAPLFEQDLQAWEQRRGIELAPWQADLVLEMSRAYLAEMYTARDWNAPCPWPPGRRVWKYVRDEKNGAGLKAALQDEVKGTTRNGNSKRRRNPPTG